MARTEQTMLGVPWRLHSDEAQSRILATSIRVTALDGGLAQFDLARNRWCLVRASQVDRPFNRQFNEVAR